MLFAFIITAIGLGIAYAASPGVVNTEAIRRGVTQSSRSTLFVETGSLVGDSLWALLALTGVTILERHLAIQIILGIAGGFFLLRMAWLALHEAFFRRDSTAAAASKRGDFATGLVFGLANPAGFAFWSGLGSGIVASGIVGVQFVFFIAGFFAGCVIWCFGISAVIRWGRRWVKPSLFRWVNALCGLALGYFGVRVLWTTAQEVIERALIPAIKPVR